MPNKAHISSKRIAFFIAVMGGLWALMVSTQNVNYVKSKFAQRTNSGMIITSDDASYLRPAENFMSSGVWKDNSQGISSYIQRPPGMGLVHLLFYAISPSNYAILHRIFALLLHAFVLYCFGLIAIELMGKRAGIIVQLIYAILPSFWGYLFYYITESLTPSLLVFLFYGYIKYHYYPSSKWLIVQSFICSAILLTRPQLLAFLFPFFYFLLHFINGKNLKRWPVFVLVCLLAFGGFISWQIRSAIIAKRFTGLHGIYDVTNNTQYRPVHRSFGELFKIWEYDGEKFHTMMTYYWMERGETNAMVDTVKLEESVKLIPAKVFTYYDKNKCTQLFMDYLLVCKEMDMYSKQNIAVPGETKNEIVLRERLDSLTKELRKRMWVENYFTTPLNSARFMFTKSQLNMAIFQHKYRGKWWMEGLRFICLTLIIITTLFSLTNIVSIRKKPLFLFAVSLALYLFYLFFFQKINEERYLVPLLPIILLTAACTMNAGYKKWLRP